MVRFKKGHENEKGLDQLVSNHSQTTPGVLEILLRSLQGKHDFYNNMRLVLFTILTFVNSAKMLWLKQQWHQTIG